MSLFGTPNIARWVRRLGLGAAQAEEGCQWLLDFLARPQSMPIKQACQEGQLDCDRACDAVAAYVDKIEPRSATGQMRRRIIQGFLRSTLLGQEADLADFLTDGFARLDFQVRPSRQDLVLALFKSLMDVMLSLKVPVVVAFDQLEDLLLVRRTEDAPQGKRIVLCGHRPADAPHRWSVFPGLRRARPVEPVRAMSGRVHPGPAEQSHPLAEVWHDQGPAAGASAAVPGVASCRRPHAAGVGRAR